MIVIKLVRYYFHLICSPILKSKLMRPQNLGQMLLIQKFKLIRLPQAKEIGVDCITTLKTGQFTSTGTTSTKYVVV